MKQWQAVLCLLLIVAAGIILVAICSNTKMTVTTTDVPEVEIVWGKE